VESRNFLVRGRWAVPSLKLRDGDVLFFYTLALFGVGAFVHILDVCSGNLDVCSGNGFFSLFEVSAGELLATVAIYFAVREIGTDILTGVDFAIVSISALFLLFPLRSSPFISATVAGLYFCCRRACNEHLQSVGQLWLAISCYELWGRVLFRLVSAPIIKLEAFVIATAGRFAGLGLDVDGIRITSDSGWYIFIREGCSSFHNVSLAVLIWLSLIKIGSAKLSRSMLPSLGLGIAGVICLNVLRILLMTPSREAFDFWHAGGGANLFTCFTLVAVAVPTAISIGLRHQ
jgi:hypothetical protein